MERDEPFCAVKYPMESSIPPVGSDDEESFVVLGTSSVTKEDIEASLNDELSPVRSSKVHDIQNLLKMETSQINSSTTLLGMPSSTTDLTLNAVATSVANIVTPESSYEEVQKQVETLIKENEKLKNIIEQNNLSMKSQYDRILAWKQDVNSVLTSYKSKFLEAKNYIDKCREEIYKLTTDVEKYKNIKELQDEEIMNLKRKEKEQQKASAVLSSCQQNLVQFDVEVMKKKNEELQTELAEANLKIADLTAKNEKVTKKLLTIEEQLKRKNDEIKNLQRTNNDSNETIIKLKNEIDKLNESLETEVQKNKLTETTSSTKLKSNEMRINQLEQENYSLKEEIATLKNTVNKLQVYETNLEEKHAQLSEQLMNSQKTITTLEQEIGSKVKEIEELGQLLQSNSKSDEIFALNEQLTVYKNDFEAERESKNAIKRERDQIAEDLQNLQKRNKQLQNEVENLRERREPHKTDGYNCPKCSFGFNNYQSLENHIHRCLDLYGFL